MKYWNKRKKATLLYSRAAMEDYDDAAEGCYSRWRHYLCLPRLSETKKQTQHDCKSRTTRLATATWFSPLTFCFMMPYGVIIPVIILHFIFCGEMACTYLKFSVIIIIIIVICYCCFEILWLNLSSHMKCQHFRNKDQNVFWQRYNSQPSRK